MSEILRIRGSAWATNQAPAELRASYFAKIVMSHLTGRYPELFPMKDVPWYAPGDEEVPK